MKKVLFIAALAVAFMACENKEEMPKGEQKALKTVTEDVVSMIGTADEATVDKKLVAAGFTKVDVDEAALMPRKAQPKMRKAIKAEEPVVVAYVYGLPADYEKMTEEELEKYMKDQMNKGDGYIAVSVTYQNDVLFGTTTSLVTALREKVNVSYTKESDALYAALPEKGIMKEWSGFTAVGKEEKEYTEHADFSAAVAAAQAISAQEMGYCVTAMSEAGYSGMFYQTYWENPDEEMKAEMIEEVGTAYAYGYFMVADINATME